MKTDVQSKHPGRELAVHLAEMGLSPSELAELIHVPKNRITQILSGRRAITADTALRLNRVLGSGLLFWLIKQNQYDLLKAMRASRKEIMGLRSIKELRDALARDFNAA